MPPLRHHRKEPRFGQFREMAAGRLRRHVGRIGELLGSQRAAVEEDLKSGRLKSVVATSSLELGIDMGSVDLVIQVSSPPSIAAGMQRIGRAGHQVGALSKGVVLPKFRGDVLACAAASRRMMNGW